LIGFGSSQIPAFLIFDHCCGSIEKIFANSQTSENVCH
jgi:hypothetical protein